MRVLIVNTSESTGGAAVAAKRLTAALNNNGVKAKMLVTEKQTDNVNVVSAGSPLLNMAHFLWERLTIYLRCRMSRKHLFEIDLANAGTDITRTREFREADIIHLHWINQGMLSLSGIRKILASGKPVVWTMHDIWPATAICHYTRGCTAFTSRCHHCQLLPGGGSQYDLSSAVWKRKERMLSAHTVHYVTCSRWLESEAKKSGLLAGHYVTSIPNTIDTHLFCPTDKAAARNGLHLPADKRIILFVSQRVTDQRKGMDYFVEAISKMVGQHPEMVENTGIAILGGHSEEVAERLALPVYPLGYVGNEHTIVSVYNAADLFVIPSLEDNLPNTVMEAMACGVPCAGFNVGGIPEMIDHRRNGYVARMRDSDDLAGGMHWILNEADHAELSRNALHKVHSCYSQHSVAMRYIDVYSLAMANKRYRL